MHLNPQMTPIPVNLSLRSHAVLLGILAVLLVIIGLGRYSQGIIWFPPAPGVSHQTGNPVVNHLLVGNLIMETNQECRIPPNRPQRDAREDQRVSEKECNILRPSQFISHDGQQEGKGAISDSLISAVCLTFFFSLSPRVIHIDRST